MTPVIRRRALASTDDLLANLKFSEWTVPALISLYASADQPLATVGFSVNQQSFMEPSEINLQVASGTIDTDRDQLMFREAVPAGRYFVPVNLGVTPATVVRVQLIIEPLE